MLKRIHGPGTAALMKKANVAYRASRSLSGAAKARPANIACAASTVSPAARANCATVRGFRTRAANARAAALAAPANARMAVMFMAASSIAPSRSVETGIIVYHLLERRKRTNRAVHVGPFQCAVTLCLFLDEFATRAAQQLLDKVCRIHSAAVVRILKDRLLEGDCRFDARDQIFMQRAAHLVHGFAAIQAKSD